MGDKDFQEIIIYRCSPLIAQTICVTTEANTTLSTVRSRMKVVLLLLFACGKILEREQEARRPPAHVLS